MADNRTTTNPIARDDAYQIVCPYCFNLASGGDGTPFSHTEVEFRAETAYANVREMEQKLGFSQIEIDMAATQAERDAKARQYEMNKRFLLGKDKKYETFWAAYKGTTEQNERSGRGPTPWELPIVSLGQGIKNLVADMDGFVSHAVDEFGKITHRRVCPHCHNPLPLGYGKNKVRYISIIGITGAGKTIYISQLLRGMADYAAKVGLSAYFTAEHVTHFIENNKVKFGERLPDATTSDRLSQPMFYDLVRTVNNVQQTDTIVLYDIAGENCRNPEDMLKFSSFVKHSDGLILLIDPKQLGFLSDMLNPDEQDDTDKPERALNTLHSVLETQLIKKSNIPIAVCVSKSDMCVDILPPMSQEAVQSASPDYTGLPKQEFDGKTFNALSEGITKLMIRNAATVCQNLQTGFQNFNFFAVSAVGCKCVKNEMGFSTPAARPDPKRIEEPILWLFKQFGYIKTNTKVNRPFKIKQADKYILKKPFLLGKARLEKEPEEFAVYEEDRVRDIALVKRRKNGGWEPLTDDDASLL